jgi:hypothetical protein
MFIVDSETLNVSIDDNERIYNETDAVISSEITENLVNGEPESLINNLRNEFLVNGAPVAYITTENFESLVKGRPSAVVTTLYFELLVAVNKLTVNVTDILNVSIHENNQYKTINVTDTLGVDIHENHPEGLVNVWPLIIPRFQTYVLLYGQGWGFQTSTILVWNGVQLPTEFISPNLIGCKIPHELITPLGFLPVYVIDPNTD